MAKVHDSETAAHGQQVITACAFVHRKFDGVDKVFLPKRSDIKKFLPGIYELPGGHIDFGEDIVEGLKREMREEFGMDIAVGDPFYVYTYENLVKGSHSVEIIFFACFIDPIEKIKLNPEDHSNYGWFSEKEALEYRSPIVEDKAFLRFRDDDPEHLAIQRGFELLAGSSLDFG
jgi:8-oxo-dGTP diphosphatase